MSTDELLQYVPIFVLVLCRVAGMMFYAPLFGSARIPRQVRVFLAIILALGFTPCVARPAHLPETSWGTALAMGAELAFGFAMGLLLSFVFVAVQWGGQMVGQQMGLNMSETIDPQLGAQGSIVGDLYYMMLLIVFLEVRGHHAMLRGVHDSFAALPLLSVTITQSLFDLVVQLFQASTTLAIQLAAPILVTMLIVDLALGFIGKTMPQFNVMSAGLTLRSVVGMIVLIVGLSLTNGVTRAALMDSIDTVRLAWVSPQQAAP